MRCVTPVDLIHVGLQPLQAHGDRCAHPTRQWLHILTAVPVPQAHLPECRRPGGSARVVTPSLRPLTRHQITTPATMALLSRPHHPSKGASQALAEAALPAANPLPERQAARNCSAAPRAWPFDLRNPRFNGSSVAVPVPPPVCQQVAHLFPDSAGGVRLRGATDTQTDTQTRATSVYESGTQHHAEQHGASSAGPARDPPAAASSWTPESGKETGKEPGQETGTPASQQTALALLPNGVAPPDNSSARPLLSPYINGGPATPSTASAPGVPPLQTDLSSSVCHIMCTPVIPHMCSLITLTCCGRSTC